MKIRNKLILSFVCVVFFPLLIVGVFLTNELRQMALNDALNQTAINVERVKKRTAEVLKIPNDISLRLMFDARFKNLVNKRYQSHSEVVRAYREFPDFHENIEFYHEISNIRFYIENPTLINNWYFMQPEQSIKQSFWYQTAIEGSGLPTWLYIEDETKKDEKFLSLVLKIVFWEHFSTGVLVINVNHDYLNTILSEEPFETMIVDENDYIVAASRTDSVGLTLHDFNIPEHIITQGSGTYEGHFQDKASKIIIENFLPENSENGLRIISIIPIESIVADANRISLVSLSVILLSLVIALILIYGFSYLLVNRLLRLSKTLSRVATGNFTTTLEIDGNDEVGQLSRQFNAMVLSISELMEEVAITHQQKNQLELKQNEIRLKMMASQINPHFLFNALESIRMKAHLRGEKDIAKTVSTLGRLMRKSLEVSGGETELMHEIDIVRCYLDIQQFRYEDRLAFDIQIDPAAQRLHIPSLIIQPIIENAVIHGLENKESGGRLDLSVQVIDEELHIQVMDNGRGMSEEKKNELLTMLNDSEERGEYRIGLRNIQSRLKLTYGEQYGLAIKSALGVGTMVHIVIPIKGEHHV